MNDLIDRLTSWKTTVIGVATALVSILVFFGVLEPENDGVELVSTFWDGALQVLSAIAGFVLIFSKDSDKG